MPEEKYVLSASRLTRGNFWFPVRIEITGERVVPSAAPDRCQRGSIPIAKVASVNITTGLI